MENQNEVPEVIMTLETMTENRKHVLQIFRETKIKYLTGKFTQMNLVKDYNYSLQSANMIIDTLARNGLLNGELTTNNTMVYSFENDKQRQIENIKLWLDRSQKELDFFTLAIQVIEKEIENKNTNLKAV